jgi:hypothetical protein
VSDFLEQLAERAGPPQMRAPIAQGTLRPRTPGLFEPVATPAAPPAALDEPPALSETDPEPVRHSRRRLAPDPAAPIEPPVPPMRGLQAPQASMVDLPATPAVAAPLAPTPLESRPSAAEETASVPETPESPDPPAWGVLHAPPTLPPAVAPPPRVVKPAPSARPDPPAVPPAGQPVPSLLPRAEAALNARLEPVPPAPVAVAIPAPDVVFAETTDRKRSTTERPSPVVDEPASNAERSIGNAVRPALNAPQFVLPAERREPASPPTITVTIGRIDIRATPAPAQGSAQRSAQRGVMSLDEYLRRRNEGSDR